MDVLSAQERHEISLLTSGLNLLIIHTNTNEKVKVYYTHELYLQGKDVYIKVSIGGAIPFGPTRLDVYYNFEGVKGTIETADKSKLRHLVLNINVRNVDVSTEITYYKPEGVTV